MEKYNEIDAVDELNKLLYIDYSYHLPDDLMIKNDRMTMAHSIEARVPFTDLDLFHYLSQVPVKFKMKGFKKKNLLRESMKSHLPKSILNKKKVGLEMPYSKWFKKELRNVVETRLAPKKINEMGVFNSKVIKDILDNHMKDYQDNGRIIWAMLNYVTWYDNYISKNYSN